MILKLNKKFTRYRNFKKPFKVLSFLILFFSLTFPVPCLAIDVFSWMTKSIVGLGNLFDSCIEVPPQGSFRTGSQVLDLADSGEWKDTGLSVTKGKMIKFDWSATGITTRPRKHLVLYRVDPRFERPQVFIQTYDYNINRYVSDFHKFKGGQLLRYQDNPNSANTAEFNQRRNDYIDYFNFVGRDRIPVYIGDVINLSLIEASDFFSPSEGASEFIDEMVVAGRPLTVMYTNTERIEENRLIYSNINAWCDFTQSSQFARNYICNNDGYYDSGVLRRALLIGMDKHPAPDKIPLITDCPDESTGPDQPVICFYTKGKGMLFTLGGTPIKSSATNFVYSPYSNKFFFYYKSSRSGAFNIVTDWSINNMFNGFPQFMKDWGVFSGDTELNNYIDNNDSAIHSKYVHFGRYFMSVEIGNGDNGVSFEEQDSIKVEYTISKTRPTAGFSGTELPKTYRVDASDDGYIWLRVINPLTQVQGSVTVKYAAYTGTTIFSDIVEDKLIKPLTDMFQDLSKLVFTKLITNVTLQNIVKTLLSLYIAFYALWFLAGAVQMTINDVLIRIAKIIFVVTLFSKTSWDFFNYYLFENFTLGIDYFIGQVVNASSSAKGMFSFIDPVFDRYTNPTLWGLLFIQLLQLHNGLAFFAIMTIYSMLTFFRGVLEIIIGYTLAYIGLTVMISLAPFFITMILFERTRSMFDNWISTLFNYMIQPTILLIFFLLIDQLIGRQITDVVTKACWGILIPLHIAIDLRHIGIPLDFSFQLPFLEGIPFWVTNVSDIHDIDDVYILKGTFLYLVTSTLLLYCYCTMARGLVEYVSTVSSMLTNVLPARQEGKFQKSQNATESIINDMKGLASPISSAADVFKDKVIDQKYKARPSPARKGEVETHVGKVFSTRQDGPKDEDVSSVSRGKNNDK